MNIKELLETPLPAPEFPSHTQSTERAVRMVTEAAASVVGAEARYSLILARQASRAELPVFQTKQDILKMFK